MINGLGMPYMGGKRKLAKPILDYICFQNPNAKYFYDLFGVGGAISFNAMQRKQFEQVNYNELNTGVVKLLKKLRADGVTKDMYKWVDRETFNAHKNDNDWYGGLLKTCWSFGNNQKDYLFGKDIEEPKRLMHEVVVNCCERSRDIFFDIYDIFIDFDLIKNENINERRLNLQRLFSKLSNEYKLKIKDICQAENNVRNIYQVINSIEFLKKIGTESTTILKNNNNIQRLEEMEQLERLQRLNITNLSYEAVKITTPINETIIYCDPPYKGTGKY